MRVARRLVEQQSQQHAGGLPQQEQPEQSQQQQRFSLCPTLRCEPCVHGYTGGVRVPNVPACAVYHTGKYTIASSVPVTNYVGDRSGDAPIIS